MTEYLIYAAGPLSVGFLIGWISRSWSVHQRERLRQPCSPGLGLPEGTLMSENTQRVSA